MLLKFSENDENTVWEYAFSSETGQRNNVELDYNSVEYDILHDDISIHDLLVAKEEVIAFQIHTRFEFGLKLTSVIRSCLGLSANQLNRMIEAEAIFTPENYSLKKHKVKHGDVVLINKQKLQNL